MQTFVLRSSEDKPIRFTGEILAECPAPVDPPPFTRWHEMRIYKTKTGKYVLQIVFGSNAKNSEGQLIEPSQSEVIVCETPDDVMKEIDDYDPNEFVIGYPDGIDNQAQKNKRLRTRMIADYASKAGDLLFQAAEKDPGFAEEI